MDCSFFGEPPSLFPNRPFAARGCLLYQYNHHGINGLTVCGKKPKYSLDWLMQKLGLKGKGKRRKYRSYQSEVGKIADNLLQQGLDNSAMESFFGRLKM
ncbi:hypothetical protein A1D29_02315 [Pasteurellaceae bacterium Orientalotternb1]|nr:hypothetical protein A1D29_02315 [Pasteurellaceae bacterium Orientalotternb1]